MTVAVAAQQRLNFDEGWKFHLGHANDPHRDFNYGIGNILAKTGEADHTGIKDDFNDKDWQDVHLPHDWAVGLPFVNVANDDLDSHGYHAIGGLFPENSIGWYRKTFIVDKADSGRRFLLQFDGIFPRQQSMDQQLLPGWKFQRLYRLFLRHHRLSALWREEHGGGKGGCESVRRLVL